MNPVILVGLRLTPDVPAHRHRNWAFNRARWQLQLPGWQIYEGHYNDAPFSMARASNIAAASAGDWEVALYVGGDFLIGDPSQAEHAVARARTTGKLTFAYDRYWMLSEAESEALVAAGPAAQPQSNEECRRNTFSGALAVPRSLWDEVGGFDSRFVGWGWEDLAFWAACWASAGGFERVSGTLYHLWHPRSRTENEDSLEHEANMMLGRRYVEARTIPEAMRAILREPGGPRA